MVSKMAAKASRANQHARTVGKLGTPRRIAGRKQTKAAREARRKRAARVKESEKARRVCVPGNMQKIVQAKNSKIHMTFAALSELIFQIPRLQ